MYSTPVSASPPPIEAAFYSLDGFSGRPRGSCHENFSTLSEFFQGSRRALSRLANRKAGLSRPRQRNPTGGSHEPVEASRFGTGNDRDSVVAGGMRQVQPHESIAPHESLARFRESDLIHDLWRGHRSSMGVRSATFR